MKRRVALVASTLEGFGLVKMMYYLAKYLNQELFTIYIITLSPEPENSHKAEFEKLGVKVLSLGKSRLNGFFFATSALNKAIRRNKIDIVHTHGFRADLTVSNIKKKNFKWIITAHSDPDSEKKHFLGNYFDKWRKDTHIKLFHSNKENVVAVSESICNRFKQLDIKVATINNGIDICSSQLPVSLGDLKSKYCIPSNKKVCLVLSGLTKNKNVETIIKAFSSRRTSDFYLMIAGDGEEYQTLKSLAGEQENIRFLGYVANPEEVFKVSDFYLTASLFEGLSLSLLEAMSKGLIPIVSSIPSHREVLQHSDLMFNCFDCYDSDELVEILCSYAEKDLNEYSQKSKDIIHTNYHAKDMATQYERLYLKNI